MLSMRPCLCRGGEAEGGQGQEMYVHCVEKMGDEGVSVVRKYGGVPVVGERGV